jgi:hypothetical protein
MPTRSTLSDTYYSKSNHEYLQKAIVDSVSSKSGYKIGRQNDMDLYNLMRKVYTDYVVNDSEDVPKQVSRMNSVVVSDATRTISSAVLADLTYLRDISTLPVPPDAPRNSSVFGLKLTRRI